LNKQSFFSSLIVFILLMLVFISGDKFSWSDSTIGNMIFFTVFLGGIFSSALLKKYKESNVSPPTVVLTYFLSLVVLVIVI